MPLVSGFSWLNFWFVIEAISIVVIAVGCLGEGLADHWNLKRRWKSLFWKTVVIGLGMELVAFGFSFIISAREIERLQSTNLLLREKVVKLEAKQSARAVTVDQRESFLRMVANLPKSPVEVMVGTRNDEADTYATHLKNLLNEAGYGASGDPIIRRDSASVISTLPYPYPSGTEMTATPVLFAFYTDHPETLAPPATTDSAVYTNYWPAFVLVCYWKNGVLHQEMGCDTNNVRAVPAMIYDKFLRCGIPSAFIGTTNWLSPNEWCIFVPPKFY